MLLHNSKCDMRLIHVLALHNNFTIKCHFIKKINLIALFSDIKNKDEQIYYI